jgi:hypothetical protein
MFKFIVDWFGKKPDPRAEAPAVQPEAAPYKVEEPVQAVPTSAPAPVVEAKPAKKAPAKKPTAVKTVAKPRAPRAK